MNKEYLQKTTERLRESALEDLLTWVVETFDDDVGMTSSFGYSGVYLLHRLIRIKPDIEVFFIDTGYHFPDTLEFAQYLKEIWDINLRVVRPALSREQLCEKIGDPPHRLNPDLCCKYCKVDPLLSFIHSKKAWISAIRRDQAKTRADIDVLQQDQRGILKIHPIYKLTSEEIWQDIIRSDLPYNPLHDKNYLSIGCQPCTKPIQGSMHEREGRWPDNGKVECGINCYL